MRILLTSGYAHPPDLHGGLQTTTHELCLTLLELGHTVAVLCGPADAADGASRPRSDEALGYLVVRVADPITALASMRAAFRPDAVVAQTSPRTVELAVAALALEVPTALYLHNVELDVLGGVLFPDPDVLFLANSPFTAARYRALFGIEAEVLTPLVRPELYRVERTRERVLFVNPVAIKGAEIAFRLAELRPQVPFTIVPSWRLSEAWLTHCRDRTAPLGNVTWTSSTADMRPMLAEAKLLLMPSLWEETYGRTSQEAQLNGIPVLASDRGNLPDTIGEGGIVVPAHAPIEQWAAALDRLWSDAAQWQMRSAAARAHAARPALAPHVLAGRLVTLLQAHRGRLRR